MINPNTGKPWVNNYLQMYGTMFANQNHKYIQLNRYYDLIGRLEGKSKAAYAMLLHNHIAQVSCNRTNGVHFNIFMYIDTASGIIKNSKEMREWIEKTGWMNCNGNHLFNIASNEVWWIVYKAMLDIGLIEQRSGILKALIPIEGRFLPIPYAYVAFLSRLKKDSELRTQIHQALMSAPDKMRANLEELPKEDLINELIKIKTKGYNSSKNSELSKMVFDEIRTAFPHQWGQYQKENPNDPENILGELSEISEKKIQEKIQEDIDKKQAKLDKIKENKAQDLSVDEIHNFEQNKDKRKSRGRVDKSDTANKESVEDNLFYADHVSKKDADKVIKKENVEKKSEKIPKKNVSDIFENDDIIDEDDLMDEKAYDIFGLPVDSDADENIPDVPDVIEVQKDIGDDFW